MPLNKEAEIQIFLLGEKNKSININYMDFHWWSLDIHVKERPQTSG